MLLHATDPPPPGRLPLFIPAPIVSDAGATVGRARVKAAPALVTLDVPPSSPFAVARPLPARASALAGDDLRADDARTTRA